MNDSKDLFDEMIGELPVWVEIAVLVLAVVLGVIFSL